MWPGGLITKEHIATCTKLNVPYKQHVPYTLVFYLYNSFKIVQTFLSQYYSSIAIAHSYF